MRTHIQGIYLRRQYYAAAAILVASLGAIYSGPATAQTAPTDGKPDVATSTADTSDAPAMDQPMVGDHWTYEVHDEITGTLKNTYTETITDITQTEISVRTETVGGPSNADFVYDNLWNLKNSPVWKYTPGDGTGVKLPLKVGSTWKSHNTALFQGRQDTALFQARSATEGRAVSSKVVAEEAITTDSGTFHTFKIETMINGRNIHDPSKKSQATLTSWYAPSIDHWVKRVTKIEANGHVTQNVSVALVDCGRR